MNPKRISMHADEYFVDWLDGCTKAKQRMETQKEGCCFSKQHKNNVLQG
jgi:hypothetical protein